MHNVANLWKFELNRSSKLPENYGKKTTNVTRNYVLSDARLWNLKFLIWGLEIKFMENYFFLENYVTSEGAVYHNVLYHQQLPITYYQGFMLIIISSNYQKWLPL